MSDRYSKGTVAYDMGQRPSVPVVVTNPRMGTVGEQKPALRELILDSPGNQAFPLDESTPCVEVRYINVDGRSKKAYTMPASRIAVPQTAIPAAGQTLPPAEYAVYAALSDMFREAVGRADADVNVLRRLCTYAGVDEAVIAAAIDSVPDELFEES